MVCLTSIRFNMKADLLRESNNGGPVDIGQAGEWQDSQDPITGEIIRVWVPITNDDPNTPDVEAYSIDCIVRSMVSYTSVTPTRMRTYGAEYYNIEYARMSYPPDIFITNRDRLTNIRNKDEVIIWRDEELEQGGIRATIFDVIGVVPILDPFGNHIENVAFLERAEIQ